MVAVAIALGRDPLQRELTPYEVLGVGRDAGPSEIEVAFKERLLARAPAAALTSARAALERPLERGVIDLLLYDPESLAALAPNPLESSAALERAARGGTAHAWESALARRFPDLDVIHGLAVFWYWWAVSDDARADEPTRDQPSFEERWRRAIGYWSMLIVSDEYWERAAGGFADPAALRSAITDRLREDLRKLPARSAGATDVDAGSLDLLLESECEAARGLAALGLRTRHGPLACGPLILQHYGLIDAVRSRVQAHLTKSAGDPTLLRLRALLSPYAPIAHLLESQRPAEALAQIQALSHEQRALPEVAPLRARALLELGREQASVGRVDLALETWASGLLIAAGADLEESLRQEIAGLCRRQASSLARQPVKAMAILEKGLELVRDESLELALAELLHHRGAELAMDAKRRLESGASDKKEILHAFTRALSDLERAAELGSSLARQDAEVVADLIDESARGPESVEWLRQTVRMRGAGSPSVLRARLATLLSNRAVETVQRAMTPRAVVGTRRRVRHEATILRMRAQRDARGGNPFQCDLCEVSSGGQFFPFELPGEPPFVLCHRCATRRAPVLERAPMGTTPLSLLATAERDLSEALALDGTAVIRQNLNELRQLKQKLIAGAESRLGRSPLRRFLEQKRMKAAMVGLVLAALATLLFALARC